MSSVDYGYIQGSALGLILFLIYINNLGKLTSLGKYIYICWKHVNYFEQDIGGNIFIIVEH